jgi:hypothetical protein
MTICATFIPTKVDAATLKGLPEGEIPKTPGDSVEFTFELTPALNSTVIVTAWVAGVDDSELSPLNSLQLQVPLGIPINTTTTILRGTYRVDNPVRGGTDAFATLLYNERRPTGNVTRVVLSAEAGDVIPLVPVPEPLTIFGTALGLGGGVLFKRKSFKKILS